MSDKTTVFASFPPHSPIWAFVILLENKIVF